MSKIRKLEFLWVIVVILFMLEACRDEETVASSEKSTQQASQESPLLKGLSGRIVFQSDRDGDWEIYVMNPDESHTVQLTDNTAADEYPVWSPDGKQIAFKSDRDGNFEIYVMNADGTNQRRLTNHSANDEDPAWSPDGKRIAFHSDRKSALEIYIMNADGSGLIPFTHTIGKNALPAWSPDGKRIAYTGNRYLGWNVYVTDLEKTDDTRITDGHGACRPDWSPDDKKIAYVSQKADGKGDIWVMNPDGSQKTQLTFDDANYDYYPAWSPDGKYLVYAKTSDKNTGNWELYVISSDGKEQARLTNHPARDKFPDWQNGSVPDELFVRQKFTYEAESAPRTTGESKEDSEASEAQAVYAGEDDKAGFLVYGPYKSYAPGKYVASFRLKTDRTAFQESVAVVDIATDAGKTILAQKELKGNDFLEDKLYQEFQIPFSLKESRILEFRVYFLDTGDLWVDKVTVTIKSGKQK
jgi:Tol biopolymer transport system component